MISERHNVRTTERDKRHDHHLTQQILRDINITNMSLTMLDNIRFHKKICETCCTIQKPSIPHVTCESHRVFSHEVSTKDLGNHMAQLCPEYQSLLTHKSTTCVRLNHERAECYIQTCRKATKQHYCTPGLAT